MSTLCPRPDGCNVHLLFFPSTSLFCSRNSNNPPSYWRWFPWTYILLLFLLEWLHCECVSGDCAVWLASCSVPPALYHLVRVYCILSFWASHLPILSASRCCGVHVVFRWNPREVERGARRNLDRLIFEYCILFSFYRFSEIGYDSRPPRCGVSIVFSKLLVFFRKHVYCYLEFMYFSRFVSNDWRSCVNMYIIINVFLICNTPEHCPTYYARVLFLLCIIYIDTSTCVHRHNYGTRQKIQHRSGKHVSSLHGCARFGYCQKRYVFWRSYKSFILI